MEKPFVIGVCGRTCSGKSSVVRELEQQMPDVLHIQQDAFFKVSSDEYKNWENPEVVRFDKLVESLKKLKSGNPTYVPSRGWTEDFDLLVYPRKYILVEGHLLFAVDDLYPLFDTRIWVDVSDENLLNRRLKRNRSNDYMDRVEYIMDVVIPESKKYESRQKSRSNIIIDGNKSKYETIKELKEKCCL